MRTHSFRQSWVNQFYHCPEQARAERAGELERTSTAKMMLGTSTHALIEEALDRIALGPLDDNYIALVLDRTLAAEPWVPDDYDEQQVRDIATSLYRVWYDQVLPDLPRGDWQTEVPFDTPIYQDDQREIRITGTADLLLPGQVIDWKTAQKPYTPWEHERWNIQSAFYTLAFGVTDFSLCVLQYPKLEVQWLPIERNPEHHHWLRDQLLSIALLIEADLPVWPLNDQGWWCHSKWCGKWFECKGAFMAHDWPKKGA